MIEAVFCAGIAAALFLWSAWQLRRGFRDVSSWPNLMFFIAFSGNVLAVPLALGGFEPFEWMLDVEELAIYEMMVVLAMISYWAGHLIVRRGVLQWRWLGGIRAVSISRQRGFIAIYAVSFAGAFIAMLLAALGFHGYFTVQSLNYSPPWWLDFARFAIGIQSALLFFVVLHSLQEHKRLTFAAIVLTALWIVAGLASAYKTLVVMPGLIVIVCAWLDRSLKARHIVLLILLIWLAYAVVEPLREMQQRAWQDNPLLGLQELTAQSDSMAPDDYSILEQFIRRADYGESAITVLSAFRKGHLSQFKQRLDETYLLAPLMAFIPRFLWPDKPLSDLGRELSIEIHRVDASSITPSQPVASYIWAGAFGVILNNLILGMAVTMCGVVVMRCRHDPVGYLPALLCAIGLSSGDTIMANYYISALRYLLVTIAFYVVLRSFDKRGSQGISGFSVSSR